MKLSLITPLALAASLVAPAAFAEGCNWGAYSTATVAEVEVEQVTEFEVADTSCVALSGDALRACLADKAAATQ